MKTRTKRWISAGLVATFVIAVLQFLPDTLPNTSHAETVTKETATGTVVRGVVDDITELPQYMEDYDPSMMPADYGTAERPFVVLEIVPYYEYAEFGYLIGGCEPIDIEKLTAKQMESVYGTLERTEASDILQFTANLIYCFEDEKDFEDFKLRSDAQSIRYNVPNDGVYGYYELVEESQGAFRYNPDTVSGGDGVSNGDLGNGSDQDNGSDQNGVDATPTPESESPIEYVGPGNGNLQWHTVNEMYYTNNGTSLAEYKEMYTYSDFEADIDAAIERYNPQNIGDRIYTKRNNSVYENYVPKFDVWGVYSDAFFDYTNKELFIRNSVYTTLPSEEVVANFSAVVKTITPSELNSQPDWIDYADLIYVAPKPHWGSAEIWRQYPHRTKKESNTPGQGSFVDYDLSWECALKIFEKVTADDNYAGIIFDDNAFQGPLEPTENVTIQVYNWNLEKNKVNNVTYPATGSKNNFYKLWCMLFCMDSYFFKQIYLNDDNPLIYAEEVKDEAGNVIDVVGKVKLQTGAAAEYWTYETFQLAPDEPLIDPTTGDPYQSLQKYWCSDEMWEKYGYANQETVTTRKGWCRGHVYVYYGDSSLAQHFNNGEFGVMTDLTKFPDFAGALTDGAKATTASAVQYILGKRSNPNDPTYGKNMTLKVLDLEPSVDLNEDETPKYFLQPTYFMMLLPNFRGDLQVTHQTTAEFIGKIEDLNATYELIYIGLDISGYNTVNGSTVWNDESLNGKIYIRKGDEALGDKYHDGWGNLSVDWLLDKNSDPENRTRIDSNKVRFAGNDISALKKAELEDYLNAGYPIVVDQRLYDADSRALIVEANTYINELMSEQIAQKKEVYGTADTDSLEDAVKKALGDDITFDKTMPIRYDGTTESPTSAVFANTSCYLPRNGSGEPYLSFKVIAKTEGYNYRIYVDLNRDSKFTKDEILNTTDGYLDVLHEGDNEITQKLPIDWVGLLQWKVEAYQVANESVRYEMSGCSAVQLRSTSDQKNVSVLQIMPDQSDYMQGFLNLEESELFKKYYSDLKDYKLTIKSITYSEYKGYFADKGFSYDYTKEVGDNNPVNLNDLDGNLIDYNMIIVGFGDCYAKTSITNEYGQLDFLRYFTDQGKSILYTHDLTTFYNEVSTDFSFYPTTRLRDTMGMNRYGAINYYFYDSFDEEDENELEMREYLVENGANVIYDSNGTDQTHGYTYFAIKRLGTNNSTNSTDKDYKLPYKYISGDYLKDHLNGLPGGSNSTNTFNFMNEITTVASKVNEGQITVYPYKIDDSLKVAPTHGQYYQLNPEDENLTVWYCLAGDDHTSHGSGDGTSLSYAVSPNDTMNNYYIYSKGNIFYSGVGHIEVKEDMEAKLFVNTMIAAFNAAAEPPKVEVTNPEATLVGTLKYEIELMQLYDFDASGELIDVGESYSGSDYIVTFKPLDYNLTSNPKLECSIKWEDGTYVKEVTKVSDGTRYHAVQIDDGSWVFKDGEALVRDVEYNLVYPAEYFSNYHWTNPETGKSGNTIRTVYFTIKNDRVNKSNTTILDMSVQPLFPLD